MGIYYGYVEQTTEKNKLILLDEKEYPKNGYCYNSSYSNLQNNELCFSVSKGSVIDFLQKILSIDKNAVVYVNTDVATTIMIEIINNELYYKIISYYPEHQEDYYDKNGNAINMIIIKNRQRKSKLLKLNE